MREKIQNLTFGLSLLATGYLLVFLVPQVMEQGKISQAAVARLPASDPSLLSVPSSLFDGAIPVKVSGEETAPVDEALKAYVELRKKFEDRFGKPFDEAWVKREPISAPFDVPEGLKETVDFWTHIFSRYEKFQYIFHHKEDLGIVYSVIDLSNFDAETSGLTSQEAGGIRNQCLYEEKIRIRKMLKAVEGKSGKKSLTDEEKRIARLFARTGAPALAKAGETENLRIQGGFAHRFKQAIALSGQYMEEMENIFTMKGLPVELTRIPLVESAFNIRAVSTADAAGLWQFIPDTGKEYLKIDEYVDERFDPIFATYAAAEHLAKEFKLLDSWPLTINAYNTGPGRMIKAKKQLKTDDITTIIKNFKEPGYQFYSRNYFPEVLAAIHVYENQEVYFGPIEKRAPLQYDLFLTRAPMNLRDLAEDISVDVEVIEQLNPGLAPEVIEGAKSLPEDYFVRVPKSMGPLFAKAAADRAQETASAAPLHTTDHGETLSSIASRYGIPLEALTESNPSFGDDILPTGSVVNLPLDNSAALPIDEN